MDGALLVYTGLSLFASGFFPPEPVLQRPTLPPRRSVPTEVPFASGSVSLLDELIGRDRVREIRDALSVASQRLGGRTVWHVSDNSVRGGVAELLNANLPYHRGEGISTRWITLGASAAFRELTKTLYYCLCGAEGTQAAASLDRQLYERVSRDCALELAAAADRSAIFILHDHHAAGLLPWLRAAGHTVVWRMHLGPVENDAARVAWDFLLPHLSAAHAVIVSSAAELPLRGLDLPVLVVAPSIDPLSAKNRPLTREAALAVAAKAGIVSVAGPTRGRADGLGARVKMRIVRAGDPPPQSAPLIAQVSRWDRVKDAAGVVRAFVEHVDASFGAHLMLVGPDTSDDRSGHETYRECVDLWLTLGRPLRERIHIIQVGLEHAAGNATIVNAFQHLSTVVTQKSLAEGFGLTVAEAGWKGRPVVASAVGGIRAQVIGGRTGFLVAHPDDHAGFGTAINSLLGNGELAAVIGSRARERVRRAFLTDSQLLAAAGALADITATIECNPTRGADRWV
jgi:trehalose synthase